MVAAFYASGKDGAQLQKAAETMEEATITDWTVPLLGRGMMRGDGLARYISKQTGGRRIEEMRMPLGIEEGLASERDGTHRAARIGIASTSRDGQSHVHGHIAFQKGVDGRLIAGQ